MFPQYLSYSLKQKISSLLNDFNFFPANQKRRFLAVDFTPSSVKILYLEPLADQLSVLNYGIQSLGPLNEKHPEQIEKFLTTFLKKNSIYSSAVHISFTEIDAVTFKYLDMPILPAKEVLSAAKWQLKEEVPFDLEKACVEWQIVKEFTDEEGVKKNGMIFVAAKKESVDKYLAFIQQSGLDPLSMEIPSISYARILKSDQGSSEVTAVLNIESQDSTLNIYSKGDLLFVRKLPVSKERFIQALTGGFVTERGRVQLSFEDAERIKDLCGIPLNLNQLIDGHIPASQIMSLIRPVLESLIREVKFSIDYFISNFDSPPMGTLYLAGEGANVINLDRYLSAELSLDVSYLPWPRRVIFPSAKGGSMDKELARPRGTTPVIEIPRTVSFEDNSKKIINAQGAIPVLKIQPIPKLKGNAVARASDDPRESAGKNDPATSSASNLSPDGIAEDSGKVLPAHGLGDDPRPSDSPSAVEKAKLLSQWEQNIFINLAGAALGDGNGINLLPLEVKNRRTKNFLNLIGSIFVFLIGIAFILFLISAGFQLNVYKDKLKKAQVHLSKIDGVRVLKDRIRLREELVDQIQEEKVPVDGVLKALSVLVPTEVVLDEFSLDQASLSLTLRGGIMSSEDRPDDPVLTNFMEQLESSVFFGEASLVFSQKVGLVQKFEIKCELGH